MISIQRILFLLAVVTFAIDASAQADVERGRYLVIASGCAACHTVEDGEEADYLAGGRPLETPFGTFFAPNITPDPETGIGGWSDASFIRAFREGVAPDGSHYYPAFPYPSYTGVTDEDLLAMKAYLFSLPAVHRENRKHDLAWYASFRFPLSLWKWFYLEPGPFAPQEDRDDEWNRGAYLVRHLGHCGECHTPRGFLGAQDLSRELAGNPAGPDGDSVPNITPHDESGIGGWSDTDLLDLLEIGMYPDGDFVGGSMVEVVDMNTARLDASDRRAMVRYLRSVPPLSSATTD
ncbi:MAG: hypothetical protein DWQ08_10235 [Proteobacteria bacterium]|nr:MAG: hypothetical protein DWQ08_10235 [Pseudomonadota bacterium]